MTLHSLEIPQEPDQLAAFIENAICGDSLSALVAELHAIAPDQTAPGSLATVLGAERQQVLDVGLRAIPFERQRELLTHPDLLFRLQEAAFAEGGQYWLGRLRRIEADRSVESAWPMISSQAFATTPPRIASDKLSRRRLWTRMSLIAAAAVLLIAGLLNRPTATTVAWGWNKPDTFDAPLDRKPYLEHLATRASEWFAEKPADSARLAQRIMEFRQGCERLLAAPHSQVTPQDKAWLLERCAVWSGKIDQSHKELANGAKSVAAVQTEMDETATKLVAALRQRAAAS